MTRSRAAVRPARGAGHAAALTQRNPWRTGAASNGGMDTRALTQQERAALVRFEAVYEEWRRATEAWLDAEVRLWTEALRRPGAPGCGCPGVDAVRLREAARAAHLRVVDALVQAP